VHFLLSIKKAPSDLTVHAKYYNLCPMVSH
jgi:hypothetical protein